TGNHTITFDFAFENNLRQRITGSLEFLARVNRPEAEEARVIMSDFRVSPTVINAGDSFSLSTTLRNTSGTRANNVQLSITGFSASGITIQNAPASNFIGTIEAGSTLDQTFNFVAGRNMDTGSYPITFNLRHDGSEGRVTETSLIHHVTIIGEEDEEERARLQIIDITRPATAFRPGQEATISITLQNNGEAAANNVRVRATPDTNIVPRLASTQVLPALAVGEVYTLTFAFSATNDAKSQFHNIGFAVEYLTGIGTQTESFEQFSGFNVFNPDAEDSTERARLEIVSITRPAATFGVGQEATISLTLRNNGEAAASNIRIRATPDTGIVPRLASTQALPALAVGETRSFTFAFSATNDAASRFYNVGFAIEYQTGIGTETDSFEQFSGFDVFNPEKEDEDDAASSVPRIIISSYNVDPTIVMANSEFDLFLTIQNTHATRPVSNIIVTFEVRGSETEQGAVFVPVNASNTFFVNEIAPRQTYDHHVRLYAIPIANPRNHTITVTFQYEDDEGNAITGTTNIGVNVRQTSRLDLGQIALQDTGFVGEQIWVTFDVHNTGRSTLYNLRVYMEGEGIETSSASQIFGNFQSGNWDMFWGNITPMEPGDTTVRIIATYDDELGESYEITEEFNISIIEMDWSQGFGGSGGMITGGGNPFGDPFGEGEQQGGFWSNFLFGLWFWIAVGVVVIGGGVAAFFIIRKKRKKDNLFDEF
ncbi:MAG: hypothetical protein FWD01_03230, partial [Defluviitaleaceae bacterium]|nr:hypothetical protein [Defluviitaleaceae bacterium]